MKQTDRLRVVKKLLAKEMCDGILITDTTDAEYISGFHASNIFLFISQTRAVLFTDFRYAEAARAFCSAHTQWRFVQIPESGMAELKSYCTPGDALGVQSGSLSVDRFDSLKRTLKKVRMVKLGNAIDVSLIAKTADEISLAGRAARIGDAAFLRIVKTLKPGMTEAGVAGALDELCRTIGSEKPAFETIVLFGSRSALPHGRPSGARLKKGDFVLFDFGCTVKGFLSDMTRTVVVGKASSRQREIYAVVEQAQKRACKAVRAGVTAGVVDLSARSFIEKAGFGPRFGHATGHGVGRLIHEKPRIARDDATVLPAQAIITVEPGIYIPGFGGVRIEDMVVVEPSGVKILTQTPKRLMEVPA